ncbi:hypothetical protein BDZ89DRAFT_1058497 [Hymenopellis radicata]|nr:hypothetical protein BDZ89DRAFT_1058497 [Hymenopellis radicata]
MAVFGRSMLTTPTDDPRGVVPNCTMVTGSTRHIPESLGSTRRVVKPPRRRQLRRQAGQPVDKAVHIRQTRIQQETEMMNVDDAKMEVVSPYLSFCIGDGERSFTILHGDSLNRIPGPPVKQRHLITRFVDPELLHGCYWSINAIPYMGFLPINPYTTCFNDSLFACIFQRKWEVAMEMDGHNWQLTAETVKQWQHLENILIWLRDLITASLPLRGRQEHLPAPLPSFYRFHCPIADPTIFSKCLMRARYAFLLMGAEISFLYALQANQASLVERIREHICPEFKLEALVDSLLESWMFMPGNGFYRSRGGYGKEGCPRHGMFVDAASCTLAHALKAYENFGVSVWFWWGNRLHTHTPKSAFLTQRFGFNKDMVQKFLGTSSVSGETSPTGHSFASIIYKRKHDQRPDSRPIQIITGESLFAALPDEQWFEFLARRERAVLAWQVDGSQAEIHLRQQEAEDQGFNERSALFRWTPGGEMARLMRRRYRPGHRVYSAIFDEWDLSNIVFAWEEHCSEGEAEGSQDVDEAARSAEEGGSCVIAAKEVFTEAVLDNGVGALEEEGHPPHAGSWLVYAAKEPSLEDGSPFECAASSDAFPVPTARNVDVVLPTDGEDGEVIETIQKRARPDWRKAYAALYPASKRKVYAQTLLGLSSCLEVLKDSYGLYIPPEFLLVKEDHHAGMSPPLEKISSSHPPPGVATPLTLDALTALSGYCDHVAWYSRGEDILAQPDETCGHPHFLGVEHIYWRGRKEHTFHFNWPERSLQIMVFRASDLLWVLRQYRTKHVEDIVVSLAAKGIQFSLTMEVLTPPVPWRSHPFRANVRRARLFSCTRVVRAALMSGGILWRLAMEHCPDPAMLLSCTKEDVEKYGARSCDSRGRVICEVSLSESEIDVIVGTYIVGRAYPPNARKDLEISWFPRKISTAGFNVGFWTQDAESWYQARIKQYLNSTAQPETQKEWRATLKLYRVPQRFSSGYEVLARRKVAEMAEGAMPHVCFRFMYA